MKGSLNSRILELNIHVYVLRENFYMQLKKCYVQSSHKVKLWNRCYLLSESYNNHRDSDRRKAQETCELVNM